MFRPIFRFALALSLGTSVALADEPTDTIFGFVTETRAGTPDVPVCLCDAATGLPLAKDTYRPIDWENGGAGEWGAGLAVVLTDDRGAFRFENVPDGKYRLVAQKWIGPFKGVFARHGSVIQLMGTADDVVVPRPAGHYDALVALRPPGRGVVRFDQEQGPFLFLSTSPPEFDPVLGFRAMGAPFLRGLIGVNNLPPGPTTVIGVPDGPLYAFLYVNDNSPGFATVEVPASGAAAPGSAAPGAGFVRVTPEPIVAGWSDGRKTPPQRLAELAAFLEAQSLTVEGLLAIPPLSHTTFEAHQAQMRGLSEDLARRIDLPDGRSARVGDLLAVRGYRFLQRSARPATGAPPGDDADAVDDAVDEQAPEAPE